MVDRRMIYTGQTPLDIDWLEPQKFGMLGDAQLAELAVGRGTVVDGLTVVPTSPTSLQVRVNPGQIYGMAPVDALPYGSIAADSAHSVMKQGIMLDALAIPVTAPATPGYSQTILIQAQFREVDAGSTVLPYFNADNPDVPWSGPNNSGQPQLTQRRGTVAIQSKAGAPATTGTQIRPSPDSGWVGLAYVTVASGTAVLTAANIEQVSGPHRITAKLPALGRIAGGAVNIIRSSAQLTIDDCGFMILDVGAWTDDITIRLPKIADMAGVPIRFMFSGRYITPRAGRSLNYARIYAAAGDTLDGASFVYCGPMDSVEIQSDGGSRWYWTRGRDALQFVAAAAGNQSIPSGIETAISLAVPGPNILPEFYNPSFPSRCTVPFHGRYRITAGVSFAAGAASGYRQFRVGYNGGNNLPTLPAMATGFNPGGSAILFGGGAESGMIDGDYLELLVTQNSGGPLTIDATRTFLAVEAGVV